MVETLGKVHVDFCPAAMFDAALLQANFHGLRLHVHETRGTNIIVMHKIDGSEVEEQKTWRKMRQVTFEALNPSQLGDSFSCSNKPSATQQLLLRKKYRTGLQIILQVIHLKTEQRHRLIRAQNPFASLSFPDIFGFFTAKLQHFWGMVSFSHMPRAHSHIVTVT